jgi:O-antigen/teichoic acid export membrane protein
MRVHRIAALLRAFLVEKGDFATILLGAGQVLIIRILANTVGYASMILLARWMGSSEYGLYSFAIAWMTLLAYLATLGLPEAALRFVAQYATANDWQHVSGLMKVSSSLAFGCGALVATFAIPAVLYFDSFLDSSYIAPTVVAIAGIPIVALTIVRSEAIRGLGWLALAWGPLQLGQPLLLLIVTAVMVFTATQLTATIGVAVSIVAYAANLIAQWGILRARLGTRIKVAPKVNLGAWLRVAASFMWISFAVGILLQAGVVVVGIFLKPEDVATYNAAAATAGLVTLPLYAATALGAPKFAALHFQQRQVELQALVTNVTRWTFWPSLVIALIFVAFGSLVLRLFGPGFEQGYGTLLILTVGQLVNAFTGPVLSLLNMTGHQVVTARVLSMSAIFGVVSAWFSLGSGGVSAPLSLSQGRWCFGTLG